MPARKRPSLADFARQEGIGLAQPEQPRPQPKPRPVQVARPVEAERPDEPIPAPGGAKEETRNPKSDFVKVSVTLPPATHDALLDLSRARRRRGEAYMISDLVREALAGWLPGRG